MYNSVGTNNVCLEQAIRYVTELGWCLVPLRAVEPEPKKPIYGGWPDLRPKEQQLVEIFEGQPHLGIGLNLGPSGLVDIEGDSPQAEAILDDLCQGLEFPCWRSRRSTHRLFRSTEGISHHRIADLEIEFRAERHQSVLPPTQFRPGGTTYEWIVDPFDVAAPPVPPKIVEFFKEHGGNARQVNRNREVGQPRIRYRDHNDYIFRHCDLREELEAVGVRFLDSTPDANGNIPCYVPEQLRGGNSDQHPSGVFNVFNGTLRDFATGENHLFFNLMEALTNEPWYEIFRRYERETDGVSGSPHSRRLGFSEPEVGVDLIDLESARTKLKQYIQEHLGRPKQAGIIHIITGPPGLGKTTIICNEIAAREKKAIILTLENRLATCHRQLIHDAGGNNARRMPVLRDTECPHPDEYGRMVRRGFSPKQSAPCRKCVIGLNLCPYFAQFGSLAEADQLCCAAIYHTHDGFYESYGNEDRPIVIFDENVVDVLLEPKADAVGAWSSWGRLLGRWAENDQRRCDVIRPFTELVHWIEAQTEELLMAKEDEGRPIKCHPVAIPDELFQPELETNIDLVAWLNRVANRRENQGVHNLHNAARYLLTTPRQPIIFERKVTEGNTTAIVRFRKNNPLPEDREIFILDATANEEVIRAIAPDWDVRVWDCPQIEQRGSVIQIMDYDVSRNFVKTRIERNAPQNPSWLVQVVNKVLDEHGPMPLISFKKLVNQHAPLDLLGEIANADLIVDRCNFPCRGHNIDSDNLLVIGTPYKGEVPILELALAIWGFDGLPRTKYEHRPEQQGDFIINHMGHEEPRLQTIQKFLVSAELAQAVGRIRPLQNDCTAVVITNAPIDYWQVDQFCASELYDIRQPQRRDAAGRYGRYVDAAKDLLDTDRWIKNTDVCDVLEMSARTGQRHWTRFINDHDGQIDVNKGSIRWSQD